MKRQELNELIKTHLHNMILDRKIEPESVIQILPFMEEAIANKDNALIETISSLIVDWEEAMGSEDKSFYTLGLRRVIDIIRNEEYKPLNKDYRDWNNTSSER